MKCQCCHSEQIECQQIVGLKVCKDCGYRWQVEIKPFKYDQQYLEFGYSDAPLVAMAWIRLSFVFKYMQNFGKLLDVGCGFGNFVRAARHASFDAYGFDVHQIDTGSSAPRVDSFYGKWDAVTLFDSFEHFEDFEKVFAIDTKWFFITVPHLDESMSVSEIKNWKHYKPDEHLHYFTVKAMHSLFRKNGYMLMEAVNLEDVIRKPARNGQFNTMTYAFRNTKW